MFINENIYNYIDLNNKSQVIDYSRLTADDRKRVAYVLTKSYKPDRFKYCKNILENIGFNVIAIHYIIHNDKVYSNKISMLAIYDFITKSNNDWSYVFEDDIGIKINLSIDLILGYEKLKRTIFIIWVVYNFLNSL